MKEKNKIKIGRYLPLAIIIMLVAPMTTNALAERPAFVPYYIPPPDGMEIITTQTNLTDPVQYGFTDPDGFNDGFQWRQSLLLAVRPSYNTTVSRLNGYTIDFLMYCPILPQTHTLGFLGNVTYIFDDGRTVTYPAGFTMTWTTHNIEQPLLFLWEFTSRWIYLTCKNVYLSLDYTEDGQFIRHIERSWINRPFEVIKSSVQVQVGGVSSQVL